MSVCDISVIAEVCGAVGEGTASLVAAPFDWLAHAMGAAAAWLFEAVWTAFDTTTLVDLTDPGYIAVYNVLFGVAVFVALIFFCLQLITGLVHRDPGALARATLGLAKSVMGSFVLVAITGLLLEITDQLAIGVVQASGNTMEGMGDRIALLAVGLTTINIGAPGVGAIVTIFLSALAISAAAIVWFSLLIRKALLLVAIVFGPVALAGATWDAAKGWFTKWVAFVIALILCKLVLVVIFLVAVAQVSAPIDADLASISDPIAGIVLMFIAAFAPYLTYVPQLRRPRHAPGHVQRAGSQVGTEPTGSGSQRPDDECREADPWAERGRRRRRPGHTRRSRRDDIRRRVHGRGCRASGCLEHRRGQWRGGTIRGVWGRRGCRGRSGRCRHRRWCGHCRRGGAGRAAGRHRPRDRRGCTCRLRQRRRCIRSAGGAATCARTHEAANPRAVADAASPAAARARKDV